MFMKFIMIKLLILCRCNCWVILFVVFRLVISVVFLIFEFLVDFEEFILMDIKVLVGLIIMDLLEGSLILCLNVVLICDLIW